MSIPGATGVVATDSHGLVLATQGDAASLPAGHLASTAARAAVLGQGPATVCIESTN